MMLKKVDLEMREVRPKVRIEPRCFWRRSTTLNNCKRERKPSDNSR